MSEIQVENDPEIERLGSKAAAEYMSKHEAMLDKIALSNVAASCILTLNQIPQDDDENYSACSDRMLLLSLRSNIHHPMEDLSGSNSMLLKSEQWRHLLMCMEGRIPSYNFITLLRPDARRSYKEQQQDLLIVPRAQFILVEIARSWEGCYDCLQWREQRRMEICRKWMRLVSTDKFSVLSSVSLFTEKRIEKKTNQVENRKNEKHVRFSLKDDLFQKELKRQLDTIEHNSKAARRGDQLETCLTASQASLQLPMKNYFSKETENRIRNALCDLKNNDRNYIIIDNILEDAVCEYIFKGCLSHFESKKKNDNELISGQSIHRSDEILFLPLFQDVLGIADGVKTVLGNIASICQSHEEWNDLLVPEVSQLALYDGMNRDDNKSAPGYVAHLDNCHNVGGEGENYRELTAIFYLNGPKDDAGSGGMLRCYENGSDCFVDVAPRAGRLVLFRSRNLLHEVTPVVGWRRIALSVWLLKDSRHFVNGN